MTKHLIAIAALLSAAWLFSSCSRDVLRGQGAVIQETRNLPAFTQVESAGTTAIRIEFGNTQKVEVSAYENLLPHLETVVSNGILRIGYKTNTLVQNDNSQVTVRLPLISAIRSFGTSAIFVNGPFNIPGLELRTTGTGEIRIDEMQAVSTTIFSSGTGSIRAFGLRTTNADILQSGTANTEITVSNELKARLSGTGNIYYKGNPSLNVRISGTGNIEKR